MTVWVDADSFPIAARESIHNYSKNYLFNLHFVANKDVAMELPQWMEGRFEMTVTDATKDSADMYILEHACEQDLVLTRDIPLAQKLVLKKIYTINDRGLHFDEKKAAHLMREREISMQMAALGIRNGGKSNSSYGKKEVALFNECFEKAMVDLKVSFCNTSGC